MKTDSDCNGNEKDTVRNNWGSQQKQPTCCQWEGAMKSDFLPVKSIPSAEAYLSSMIYSLKVCSIKVCSLSLSFIIVIVIDAVFVLMLPSVIIFDCECLGY